MRTFFRFIRLAAICLLLADSDALAQKESLPAKAERIKNDPRPGVVFSHAPGFYGAPFALRLSKG